jgi:hypothetical protein
MEIDVNTEMDTPWTWTHDSHLLKNFGLWMSDIRYQKKVYADIRLECLTPILEVLIPGSDW